MAHVVLLLILVDLVADCWCCCSCLHEAVACMRLLHLVNLYDTYVYKLLQGSTEKAYSLECCVLPHMIMIPNRTAVVQTPCTGGAAQDEVDK